MPLCFCSLFSFFRFSIRSSWLPFSIFLLFFSLAKPSRISLTTLTTVLNKIVTRITTPAIYKRISTISMNSDFSVAAPTISSKFILPPPILAVTPMFVLPFGRSEKRKVIPLAIILLMAAPASSRSSLSEIATVIAVMIQINPEASPAAE